MMLTFYEIPNRADASNYGPFCMRFPPPKNARDVFQMFGLYDKQQGLKSILDRFDLGDASPDHLQRIVLGHVAQGSGVPSSSDGSAYMQELLSSDEFRRPILANFLNAFPEKTRLLFVHIPKCAGTDLAHILSKRYLTISGTIDHPAWFTVEGRFEYLRDLVLSAPFIDTFFVGGHVPLRFYLNRKLIRPHDRIFTIIRDPIDLVISSVNYRLTRLLNDRAGKSPDTREWLNKLGWQSLPDNIHEASAVPLAKQMLRDSQLVPDNTICRSLGDGTSASALANVMKSGIEITDITRYESWLRENWGVPRSARANASRKILTDAILDPADRAIIMQKTEYDSELYCRVMEALGEKGLASIRGSDIKFA